MAKTSKGVILSQASQIKSDYSFALIKATADNKSLVQDASSAELKVNALVEYSKDSQWDPKKLTNLGFPAGCFLIVDLRGQDIHAADLITNLALVRQYGYQAGVIDDLSTLDDIKALKANQIYLINSGKTNDDQDASLNGNEITDGSGKLAVGMSVKWQRDYTNVDVSGDHAGFVGMGQDTLLKGGNAFGYSTNGRDFNAVITPKGLIFRRPDAERMWRLLKPNEIADINSTVGDKVKKEVDSATAEIPAAVSAANSAVSAAESAIAASKVNSDAIVAQSEAISEAKSAMDSATAEIQQTAANAASDAAKIRADVARVQNEVDTAKAANSASVEALKSDINTAKQDLADVHDSLDKAQSAIEQNQKLINDSVAKITSDVSATKQDLADVHDSLTKAQAAAEQNQKAIDKSIAQINDSVDATNQDLADVRKDLTKAQSDITANQKAVNDNVAQINSNIEQDRKDIASAQQANADTAKQLDTYSKQATEQGKTIKTIQDKQDGFTATLADVQGNVSQVSDKVDGLSASLKDTQGNVASVKAQADQLSATLTNHGKSIATLTASAKELSSTLEDADGRLSKVEQTAQTNSSTLSDVQGDLSQVKQDATTLTSTLKDAQGNISTLQQKADSVSAQLASAQGDIATLQTGVDSVKATLTSHDKSIHTLQADSKSLKDSMTNAQGDISALSKTATSLDSEMKDHAGRLSKVEQSADTQATTLSDLQGNLSRVKQQADGLVTTLKDAQGDITQIQQKADGTLAQLKSAQGDIASLQTDVTGIKATLTSHEGDIHTLQADSKTLKDNMTDAQGSISSLKKSATDLTSEMSSQGGRLSKVEQTAKEHTSTISDLGDKLNNMKIGGRNLLTNTDKDISVTSHTTDGWPAWANVDTGFSFEHGKTYTFSTEAKNSTSKIAEASIRVFESSTNTQVGIYAFPADGKRHSITFSIPNDSHNYHLLLYAGHAGIVPGVNVTTTYHHPKLEEGNVATDWTPAPEDLATVTQVKQTADGIETTLKSAQGDIDQIKQTAKGTSEQLSNVQGDVTNIQKDVNGLKQTTADNAGNIHTLQADSETLKDDMTDVKGNISSLQKTSTSLVSEFRGHDGRLSKVEQTATEHTSELTDTKGNLDKVTQKANALQLLLSDAQKNIQNIQLDAEGLHDTLTGQSNQLASLNVTLNNLDSKYSGITGDLQSKQTALSTEQQQTKDMLLRKADKSEVDNVKGTVNQVSAEQKTMADQINQKVSSVEYQTLKDKVNGMKVGGRNLLIGTSEDELSGKAYNFVDYQISGGLQPNKTYTLSGWARVDQDSLNHHQNVFVDAYSEDWSWAATLNISSSLTSQYNKITFTTPNGKQLHPYVTVYLSHPDGGTNENNNDANSGMAFIKKLKLEEGDFDTDYTHAPEDTITVIQKNATAIDENSKLISLMAKQTEVDTVKNTAQQISSRLDILAGEVKSKVDETRVNNIVDSKGYATTSTVQSLITQKAGTINESITNLTNEVNTRNGVNLLKGTKDFSGSWHNYGSTNYWHTENLIDPNGNHSVKSDSLSWYGYYQPIYLDTGDYTFSGYYYSEGGKPVYFYVKPNSGDNLVEASYTSNLDSTPNGWRWFVVHFKVTKAGNAAVRLESGQNQVLHIASYKLERGTVTKPVWTPAPSDNATVTQVQSLTASIDGLQSTVANKADKSQITQLSNVIQSKVSASDFNDLKDKTTWKSTDNIDLNSAVSQQKIFVTGGSNLPPGDYWWYVQVEPGYDSRIVQYAVSDHDNLHYSRQYDGSKWSAWSQGATESEITQLRDDINLRVKSGDLLSQINLTAHNTLIQSNKIYLDSSSTVFSGKAFIPSAAIVSLDADKINTGTLNTQMVSIGDDQTRLWARSNYLYLTGKDQGDAYNMRIGGDKIEFVTTEIPNDAPYMDGITPMYQIAYDGDTKSRLKIRSFNRLTGSNEFPIEMYDSVNISKDEIDLAANNQMKLSIRDDGVHVRRSLFFENSGGTGVFGGFTRADNSNIVEFSSGDNKGENFHVNSGARFMQYVYINGNARAQQWLTNSALSKKMNIRKLDLQTALNKIRQDDQYLYEYKRNVAQGIHDPQASFIIDDVHDVAHYSVPREFIDNTGKYREPSVELAYLIAAFQAIDKQVQVQQSEIKALKEQLQHE